MKVTTLRFGEIEISPEEIIEFPEGLLGFDHLHRYVILNTQKDSPFRWLQCVEDGQLAFVIIEPLSFMFSYDLEISDSDAEFLGLKKAEDVILYAIVTIPENVQEMTANLQGPIVINAVNRKARQVISNNPELKLKTRILDEMAKRTEKINSLKPAPTSPKKEDES
ncbi:flagellar assembly protein FliW [bacterium]|nr:flagellar assembly protein FliW [bacterium]